MVEFPEGFFEDEVRDGFYVNGLMKRCWAAHLEVLSDIWTVCEKHNIKWYVDCGTLLGAVRHGGFVPWDDDVDICMFRDDYMRFIAVAEKELMEIWKGYKLFNFRNGDYWEVISRVVDRHAVSFDEDRTKKFHGFPLEVGVDIFPIDYLCANDEDEEKRMTICNTIFSIADDERLSSPDKDIMETLTLIELATGYKFDTKKSLQMQLYTYGEKMFALYDRRQAKYAALMGYWLKDKSHRYELRWFEDIIMMPFENVMVPVPACYDSVLKTEYGDYMKIVRTGGAHDYPRYEKQIEALNKEHDKESPFYKRLSRDDLAGDEVVGVSPRATLKNQIGELNKLLVEAYEEFKRLLCENDVEGAVTLLEDCQNTAIYIGTFIEENYGEGHPVVKNYEDYCEIVYNVHESLLRDHDNIVKDSQKASLICNDIHDQLQLLEDSVEAGITVRKEVVFLPYRASLWGYMQPLWQECSLMPDTDVYVIPIPYYDKSPVGKLDTEYYDGKNFPEELEVIDYNTYRFSEHLPDTVYVQAPFDNDNFSFSVHPYYYSSNLKKYTNNLVYVQSFVHEEIMPGEERAYKAMNQYVLSPGVVNADRVIVQSEHMKDMYVRKLVEYFGASTENIWRDKITSDYPEVYDLQRNISADTNSISDLRKRCFGTKEDTSKKILLYNIGVGSLYEYKDKLIEKLMSSIDVFDNNKDGVFYIWRSDPLIDKFVKKSNPELYDRYLACVECFVNKQLGIFDDKTRPDILVELIDAYYGDSAPMVEECRRRGIPVMIQNVDI